MKKPVNAIILSALVFPGAGHIYLKKYYLGFSLLAISLVSLIYLIANIFSRAFEAVEEIQMGRLQPDMGSLLAYLSQQSGSSNAQLATYAIIGCWLVGVISCYIYSKEK